MNVTLRQLRAFCAVVESGSFTDAASSLFVTQSALSGLIRELESGLGVQVLHRSTRRVAVSEAGREFYPLARKVLQDLDGALEAMADVKALKKGVVRLAVPQLLACTVLPEAVAGFAQAYPEVEVRLQDSLVEQVVSRVHSGEVDFGVGPERNYGEDLVVQALFELPFGAVYLPGHALEKERTLRWEKVLQHPLIALQGEFTQRLLGDLRPHLRGAAVGAVREVHFMTTAFAMVRAGLGVSTCLPYAQPLIDLYGLRWRLLHAPVVRRKFFVLHRKDRALSAAAQAFVEHLQGFVARQAWAQG
ncbi:MAG: LysR substrate-binding domain-containing protein [Rhodoferax sp.]